ncbi:GPR1/FUN34/yaaH family-domain-containing protein [Aspergillus welwitschiae]|uniref:GPR1/FUN34/yaaH family-domain-containing protein n=1 Tax=Aspergillus welwitschiae TaxID=1341132 RepID=A0A3F3PWN1_9EURO|nr:GPR1/FUN34/yaaH family-domain-containing protein [Aspergillus welwitschiae]RDH31268.1 GPR1/FUN34/yaaH family-domain-containing protein [Aspergillus welwitschiae]
MSAKPTNTQIEGDTEMLSHMPTTDSIMLPIPRDTFEKLYLTPKMPIAGRLRQTFGNPTPISLMGFLVSATPNAMLHMGWRGAGGDGGAILPAYIAFGGMTQIIGAIGEWIIGNTFSCAIFFTYGAFWLAHGASLMPFFAVGAQYSSTGDSLGGMETAGFHATAGLYYVTLSVVTFVFLICSIRTNVCLFLALLFLTVAYNLYAAVYFTTALGQQALAAKVEMAAGACNFILCIPIWYIFVAQMLESIDFPFVLPVGDLSEVVLGRNQKAQRKVDCEG